ncbi:MAG: hypothetical protein AAF799_41370 [Myxococcota bacterium]
MRRWASVAAVSLCIGCTTDPKGEEDVDDDFIPMTTTATGTEGTGAGNGPGSGPSAADTTTDDPATTGEPETPIECQDEVLPPGIPGSCLDAVLDFMASFGGVSSEEDLAALCSRVRAASDFVLLHSSEEVMTPSGDIDWTLFKGYLFAVIDEMEAAEAADARPCGEHDDLLTLCLEPFAGLVSGGPVAALGDGPALVVTGIMQGPIPMDDPDQHAQFGFVFETDGDASNDWQAQPPFTFDFFQGTDLWIQALYDPATGWSMEAARIEGGSSIVPYESGARIVIDGATVYAIVPMEELGGDCPRARLTAFAHGGDFGLQPPHTWSGDNELPIDQPMLVSCRA